MDSASSHTRRQHGMARSHLSKPQMMSKKKKSRGTDDHSNPAVVLR